MRSVMFKQIDIEICSMCDLKCTYCPNSVIQREDVLLDEILFYKIISELQTVRFYGTVVLNMFNEPFLHPKIIEYVVYIKKMLPYCQIDLYSNGNHLTKEIYDKIEPFINVIIVTKHSGSKNTDLCSTFKKVLIGDLLSLPKGSLHNRCGVMTNIKTKARACFAKMDKCIINHKGDMLLCCDDFLGESCIGNVRNNTIFELWNSQQSVDFRNGVKTGVFTHEICKKCNYTFVENS